ncbi:type II toxin-antitoxin system Phd/YefM family antitoxin [Candidatus Nomurabacteria bacterium]|nr:type II toxin-antitoxin system Phd/YefM family antitoxin [Candidatus Nomurabacteria bacterium]
MRHNIISVSKAKTKLLELTRRTESNGEAFLLTRDGSPVSALVPLEDYESLVETSEIISNPTILKHLNTALKDEQSGRTWIRDLKGRWKKF